MAQHQGASTFLKGLRILELFEDAPTGLTMADVARRSGFDRAAARRLCLALEDSGYVVRHEGVLSLSPKVVALAGGYLSAQGIGRSVQPVLNQFAELLQGEIALVVRDEMRAVYVARSAVASARMSFGFSVGSRLPLLSTAAGRMLVAQTLSPLREQIVESCVLERHTPRTEMDRNRLTQIIESAAAQGYALAEGEFEAGIAGIAVPTTVVAGSQAVLATSLSLSAFDVPGQPEKVLDALQRAAMQLRA